MVRLDLSSNESSPAHSRPDTDRFVVGRARVESEYSLAGTRGETPNWNSVLNEKLADPNLALQAGSNPTTDSNQLFLADYCAADVHTAHKVYSTTFLSK